MKIKRILCFFLGFSILFVSFPVLRAKADNPYHDEHVRVGLAYGSNAKNSASFEIASGTGKSFDIGWIDHNTDVFTSFYNVYSTHITVSRSGQNYDVSKGSYVSDGSDSSNVIGRYHIQIGITPETPEDLAKLVSKIQSVTGYYSYPAYTAKGYRVRVGRFTSETSAKEVVSKITDSLHATEEYADTAVAVVKGGSNGYYITEYGTKSILFEWDGASQELAIRPTGGKLPETYFATPSQGTRRFYGIFDFHQKSSTVFNVINVVSIALYIRGVVPYELRPTWPNESLKAMAVIAATFAMYNEERHDSEGFDICSTTHCEVYKGIGDKSERNETSKIVDICNAVSGMVITYNREPIQAVYHSSNGGFTEDSENVWTAALPYLRSVPEKYEQNTMGYSEAQKAIWSHKVTSSELTKILKNEGYSIGNVTDVWVSARTPAGGVLTLSISDGKNTIKLSKSSIKSVIGSDILYSLNFNVYSAGQIYVNDGTLLSSGLTGAYAINGNGETVSLDVNANTALTGTSTETISNVTSSGEAEWTFDGGGWGHSLGLCQWGSWGMAEAGFTFDQIIKYYYTGVEISGLDY